MTRSEAGRRYPGGLRDYSMIIRDVHRSMWRRGEWTNDTEEVLAVTESICACEGPDCNDFARRLHEFYCMRSDDIPAHMRWLFNDRNYLDDPVETAKNVWNRMKNLDASNECLGREVIIGLWSDNLRGNALRFCQLTHPHPRCECSALLVATMANSLMWHDRPADLGTLLSIANDADPATLEFVEIAHDGKLSEMNLDDPSTLWYVRKTMGSALWALLHCDSPEEGLYRLVDAAGDAAGSQIRIFRAAGWPCGESPGQGTGRGCRRLPLQAPDGEIRTDILTSTTHILYNKYDRNLR